MGKGSIALSASMRANYFEGKFFSHHCSSRVMVAFKLAKVDSLARAFPSACSGVKPQSSWRAPA